MPHLSRHRNYIRLLQKRGIYHLLFWIAYFVFAALISLSIHRIYDWHFYLALLSLLPPDILLVYLNIYVLIPFFLFQRKFIAYSGLLLISIFLQSALYIWLHGLYARAGTAAYAGVTQLNVRNLAIQALNAIYLLGLTTGLKFVKDWMLQERQWQEKERQHAETELNFLKSQVHPHFFFNTLNNLYSLTIQKSDLAPEVVLRLSDLMSYMLYGSAAAAVPLGKEIVNLENYIAIEQLRYGRRLTLTFEQAGITDAVEIPPLILLAFVENSFKHGLKNNIGSIHIALSVKVLSGILYFTISNPNGPASARQAAEDTSAEKNGIGLKNVTRRLDLLYGSRYTLDLSQTDDLFKVALKIPLS